MLQKCLACLGLLVIVAVLLLAQGCAQGMQFPKASERELDELFFSLVPFIAVAGIISGVAMGLSLRKLRHRQDAHFPSRIRRFALTTGALLTGVCEAIYLGAGAWRQIHPMDVLTHGESTLIPFLFAILWYVAAYGAIRGARWSGRYALWPRLKGGHS